MDARKVEQDALIGWHLIDDLPWSFLSHLGHCDRSTTDQGELFPDNAGVNKCHLNERMNTLPTQPTIRYQRVISFLVATQSLNFLAENLRGSL